MDKDDTKDFTVLTPAIERRNRIERLASPEQSDELLHRLSRISQRIRQGVVSQVRLFMEGRDAETMEAAALALKMLSKPRSDS